MPDAMEAGAPSPATPTDVLPNALTIPARINVRNADQKIDASGRASHLDENGMVASVPVPVVPGTVLFTTIFLDSINTAARGLVRVKSARSLGEDAGYEMVTDFVDLNDDSRNKIRKLLSGEGPSFGFAAPGTTHTLDRHFDQSSYAHGLPHSGDITSAGMERARYFEPAPLRPIGKPTTSVKFWSSLGVTAYVLAALIVLAFFPATRAIELQVLHSIGWGLSRIWFWANNINHVQLYNNTNK